MGSTTYGILLCELSYHGVGGETLQDTPKTLGESLWLMAIAMTTVGFGDLAPISSVGRLLTLIAALVQSPAFL